MRTEVSVYQLSWFWGPCIYSGTLSPYVYCRGPKGASAVPCGADANRRKFLSALREGRAAWQSHLYLPGFLPADAAQPPAAPVFHAHCASARRAAGPWGPHRPVFKVRMRTPERRVFVVFVLFLNFQTYLFFSFYGSRDQTYGVSCVLGKSVLPQSYTLDLKTFTTLTYTKNTIRSWVWSICLQRQADLWEFKAT